jgi:hypothetical protein
MDYLSPDEMKAKTDDELIAYNQALMSMKDAVTGHQLKVKAELNARVTKAKFDAMPDAEKQALAQYINAGALATGVAA